MDNASFNSIIGQCARLASRQAWPTEQEVKGSNPLPSSFDIQAGIFP